MTESLSCHPAVEDLPGHVRWWWLMNYTHVYFSSERELTQQYMPSNVHMVYVMLCIDKVIFAHILPFFMPPPLGAGGIMFSGCPSVRPSVRPSARPKPEIPSFDLYMGPLVHLTNRNHFTACPSVRLSVHPSVRPSVRRGFRAFAGERMEGMAWNFTCGCILTIFRTDQFMATVCWFF